MRTIAVVLVVCCLVASMGCRDAGPTLGAVKGSVSFRGKPIENGTIIFVVPGQRQSTGRIVAGQIGDMATFQPNDGVPLGSATIAIFANEPTQAKSSRKSSTGPADWTPENLSPMVTPSLIPVKYNNPKTSGLTCEIQPGQNELHLILTDDR